MCEAMKFASVALPGARPSPWDGAELLDREQTPEHVRVIESIKEKKMNRKATSFT